MIGKTSLNLDHSKYNNVKLPSNPGTMFDLLIVDGASGKHHMKKADGKEVPCATHSENGPYIL